MPSEYHLAILDQTGGGRIMAKKVAKKKAKGAMKEIYSAKANPKDVAKRVAKGKVKMDKATGC